MPYADQSDLLQRLSQAEVVQLTDDAKTGQANVGTVQGALESASGLVDSYCRNRYQTPLEPSDTATDIAADIAVYKLFARRPSMMREQVKQNYEDALALLKDISTGKASLDIPAGAPAPQTVLSGAVLPVVDTNAAPVPTGLRFSDFDLQGFI